MVVENNLQNLVKKKRAVSKSRHSEPACRQAGEAWSLNVGLRPNLGDSSLRYE